MPIYEYQCLYCYEVVEVVNLYAEAPPPDCCPKCGGPLKKLMTSPAIAKLKTPAYGF